MITYQQDKESRRVWPKVVVHIGMGFLVQCLID